MGSTDRLPMAALALAYEFEGTSIRQRRISTRAATHRDG